MLAKRHVRYALDIFAEFRVRLDRHTTANTLSLLPYSFPDDVLMLPGLVPYSDSRFAEHRIE
ncbi:MAG: hypothetical protein ACT4QD_04155 [Acidobacteriota bacterium]